MRDGRMMVVVASLALAAGWAPGAAAAPVQGHQAVAPAAWTAPAFASATPAQVALEPLPPAPTTPTGPEPTPTSPEPAPTSPEPAPTSPGPVPAPTTPAPTGPGATPRCISDEAFAAADDYARGRPGDVSFAVLEDGVLRAHRGDALYRSASIVKVMTLAADLRRLDRLHAPLAPGDRKRQSKMIQVSDNAAASATFALVGREGLLAVAGLIGMTRYTVDASWGTSQVSAADQALLFGRLHTVLPRRHRAYARRLLGTIVPEQTWGGARVARRHGWLTLFKAGWLPRADGWVVHQGLRIERGNCTLGLAMLTGRQRTMSDGVETIRAIAERLLAEPRPPV